MNDAPTELLHDIADYYSRKLAQHGTTSRGVDWNSEDSQFLRFRQLARIIQATGTPFSIIDLGCGYGAFLDYLANNYSQFYYTGLDISPDMVATAQQRHADRADCSFIHANKPRQRADYCVASGIFNVRLGHSDSEWQTYLLDTLDDMDRFSHRGFAFNCLTSWSDHDKMRPTLYYPDPARVFSVCMERYGRNVALLHDYGLYEFTILVRKTG